MQVTTAPLFAAELTPPRTLSREGLRLVVGLVVVLACLPALAMVPVPAGLIAGAMLADLAAVALILWTSADQGRRRETVTLWADRLELVSVSPRGAAARLRLDPASVRLIVERDFDERTTGLKLRSPEGDTEIGAFLPPEEKASFARAFGRALRKARA